MARPGTFEKGNKAALGNKGPPPRSRFLTDMLVAELNRLHGGEKKTKAQKIIDKMVSKAIKGDTFIMKEIFDRVEGKVVAVAIGGEQGTGGGLHLHVTVDGGLPDDV